MRQFLSTRLHVEGKRQRVRIVGPFNTVSRPPERPGVYLVRFWGANQWFMAEYTESGKWTLHPHDNFSRALVVTRASRMGRRSGGYEWYGMPKDEHDRLHDQ